LIILDFSKIERKKIKVLFSFVTDREQHKASELDMISAVVRDSGAAAARTHIGNERKPMS